MFRCSCVILGLILLCRISESKFSPNVTVTSCNSRRVVVKLENAEEGGIIFIQGQDTECRETTLAETKTYAFDFDLCNIEYDKKFRVVVQKNPMYQTGFDKVIPVMCLVDTSDLYVTGMVFPMENLESLNGLNKTVKPTVRMRISAGSDVSAQTEVTEVDLNDNVKLTLTLDDPYIEDFDIKAKDCRAEMISLVQGECSEDETLFPNFEKQNHGQLLSAFKAFRPTNTNDEEEVELAFTCNVAVCKGECKQKVCGQIVGWGRKKRDDEDDDDNDDVVEKVTCATKLKVRGKRKPQNLLGGLKSELEGQLCAEKVAIVSVMTVTLFTLIVSWIVCACVTSKLRSVQRAMEHPSDHAKKPNALRRRSEKNINFARSVGRRLSNMLNLPVGYNMQDNKMVDDCIPEAETPPNKRRDSVTVRPYLETDHSTCVNKALDTESVDKYESHCFLRKRYIEVGVQADMGGNGLAKLKPSPLKSSPVSKSPFSFITSISIKSGVSKQQKVGSRSASFSESEHVDGANDSVKSKSKYLTSTRTLDMEPYVNGASLQRTDNPNLSRRQDNFPSPYVRTSLRKDYTQSKIDDEQDYYDVNDTTSQASENDTDRDSDSINSNADVNPTIQTDNDEPIKFVGNVKLERKYSTQV